MQYYFYYVLLLHTNNNNAYLSTCASASYGTYLKSLLKAQSVVLSREALESASPPDDEEALEDLGHKADLYIFNQDDALD